MLGEVPEEQFFPSLQELLKILWARYFRSVVQSAGRIDVVAAILGSPGADRIEVVE